MTLSQKTIGAIIMAIVLPFSAAVIAQTWHTANQSTVAWDAVTTNTNGDPIPEGETVKYDVYLSNALTDLDKANPVKVADSIVETRYTVTLNTEGHYFVGVQAERWQSDTLIEASTISWSDNPLVAQDGVDFGIRYYLPPARPTGLRRQ